MSKATRRNKRVAKRKRLALSAATATHEPLMLRASLGAAQVDRDAGIIRDVAVISLGPAKGHGFEVDAVMLQQVYESIVSHGGRLPIRYTHPGDGVDPLPGIAGELQNVRLTSTAVRGDVHLLPSFSERDRILDIAERMPKEIGLSIEVPGDSYSFAEAGGVTVGRVQDVRAADLVGRPAANPSGLLAEGTGVKKMSPEATAALRAVLNIPESIPDEELENYIKVKAAEMDAATEEVKDDPPADPPPDPQMGEKKDPPENPAGGAALSEKEMSARVLTKIGKIRGFAKSMKLSEEWAEKQINANLTFEQVCANAVDERRRLDAQTTPTDGSMSMGDSQVVEAALCLSGKATTVEKMFNERTLEAAHKKYRHGLTLGELIVTEARTRGFTGFKLNTSNLREALQLAFSTVSLPGITSNVANKFLLEGWNSVDQSWMKISSRRPVNDFKQITSYRLTGNTRYQKVGPTGELQHGTLGEESFTNQADTYGIMLSITRQMLINDDLGALSAVPRKIGYDGARAFNLIFWAAFLNNTSFFAAGNSNYAEGASTALGYASLGAAETLFLNQTDPDGNPVAINPAILLVPTALKGTAEDLMVGSEVRDTTASTKYPTANRFKGRFEVVSPPYLHLSSLTGYSALKWYLIANPAEVPVVETVFLNGVETPTVETAEADFNTLGIQMRGYHDWGTTLQDPRGGVAMKGEA